MSKQTAVEYLVEKLNQCEPFYSGVLSLNHKHYIDLLIQQAIQMEKEQIIKALKYAFNRDYFTPNFNDQQELFENYYNETYN